MTRQFAVDDIVRLNGTKQEAKVIGFDYGSDGSLVHVEFAGIKMSFNAKFVTLVRSGGTAQPNHPRKIET